MMDRVSTRHHANRILNGLVKLYYEKINAYEKYHDPENGGMYEHKLARRLNYELVEGRPPVEFLEGARMLEGEGYVRRNYRREDFDIMGIWPTQKGLDRHEYMNKAPIGKLCHHLVKQWPAITVSVVTAVLTTLTMRLLF